MPRVTRISTEETPIAAQTEVFTTTLRGNSRGLKPSLHEKHAERDTTPLVSERGQEYLMRLRAAEASQALYKRRAEERRGFVASKTPKSTATASRHLDERDSPPATFTETEQAQLNAILRRQKARESSN